MQRKVVVPPSLDQDPFLLLSQESNSSASGQTISKEIEHIYAKETLPLQTASDVKGVNDSTEIETVEIEKLVAFELPETPAPLPLMYSDTVASMPTDQTEETQDDPPGRLQFAPRLRLSQGRANGKTPGV